MKKRFIALLLCFVFCSLLFACGNTPAAPESSSEASDPDSESEAPPVTEIKLMDDVCGVTCIDGSILTDEVLSALKAGGVNYIKVHVPYPYEADGISLTSSYLSVKRVIKKISAAGLGVLAQSFTPGGNAYDSKTNSVRWVSYLPDVFDGFDDPYFEKICKVGTSFIAKDLKDYVSQWLVSNEPDVTVFTGSMTLEQIRTYIFACAEGLDEGNPGVKTGVNLFASANPQRTLQLMKLLYAEGTPLDFLGLDSYFGTLVAGGAEDWTNYIDTYQKIAKVPVLVTEFSYSSAEYDPSLVTHSGLSYNSPVCRDKKFSFEWAGHERNETTQAEYVTTCLKIFSQNENVIGSFWFQIEDFSGPCWECGEVLCPMNSSWGLLREDTSPKPAMEAYQKAVEQFYE